MKPTSATKERRLAIVMILNLVMIAGLVIVGFAAHSLGVLAAGADYVGDAAGVGISLLALRADQRRGHDSRAPTFAALANTSFLLIVTLLVVITAIHRLIDGTPQVHGFSVLIVSSIAAAVMIACAGIIGEVDDDDLNMRSVLLDTVADAAASIGVAVSGALIMILGGTYWLDPAVALLVSLVITFQAVGLLRQVIRTLRSAA